ncbi:MAG: D-glycero-beta-D-manno-heptose 1,7-bisphosphate 7-phosphatase [Anaerolineae bacterium]
MHPLALFPHPFVPAATPRPAVFLDRDGVLNENRADYVRTRQQVVMLPGVEEALGALAASAFAVVVVTNQSALGRGLMSAATLAEINHDIVAWSEQAGGRVDAVYACPHAPDAGCPCRKPRPGMLTQAAADLNLDLSRSWLVGDAVSDLEAAAAAGCQPLLVLTGRGARQRERLRGHALAATPVVADLAAAVRWVLGAGDRLAEFKKTCEF